MSPPQPPCPSVNERLDVLKPYFSWFYVRLLVLAGISWAIQAAVVVLFAFTRVLVDSDIDMGARVLEVAAASVFMGGIVGGPLFGHIADSFGRRLSLVIAFVLSLGGLAVAARANAGNVLIIGHIITGLGIGGQITATIVLVQELSPRAMYGRMIAILEAFTGIGGLLGVLLAFAVAPQLEWRTTYLVTCGFVVYATVLHFTVPESPRWLDHVGRNYEALSIVEQIERSHRIHLPDDIRTPDQMKAALVDDSDLFSPALTPKASFLKKMMVSLELWVLWIIVTLSSYVLGTYLPTMISLDGGYNMFDSWTTVGLLNIAFMLGSLAAVSVLSSFGRHRSLLGFTVLVATTSIVLSYVPWSRTAVITGMFFTTMFLAGTWSCVLAYTPGQFATAQRGRDVGYTFGISRMAAVGGLYLCPHMFNVWTVSVPAFSWCFGGILVAVGVGIVLRNGSKPSESETNLEIGVKPSVFSVRGFIDDRFSSFRSKLPSVQQ